MKITRFVALTAVVWAISATDVQGQAFGIQGNWGDDTDFGIGARVEYGLPNLFTSEGPFSRTYLIGSFDYFFPDCDPVDCSFWEINGNMAVPITATGFDPYAGLGLNIAHMSVDLDGIGDASETEVGLNLLGGVRFGLGTLKAFTEGRFVLSGSEQFVLTFGVLVGGDR